jgi:hypothetical protein
VPLITDPAFTPYFKACEELFGNRSGKPFSMESSRSYKRIHRVYLNRDNPANKFLGPISVSLCPYLPLPGSFYQTAYDWDKLAILTEQEAQEENKDDWLNWIVTSTYSTDLRRGAPIVPGNAASQSQGAQNNPEMEKPEVNWSFGAVQVALTKDLDGVPILNSAGLPFSPPPTFTFYHPILSISRNERNYNVDRAEGFAGALSDAEFLKRPPKAIQIEPPQVSSRYKGTLGYWRASYKLNFAPIIPNQNMNLIDDIIELPEVGDPDTIENFRYIYKPWDPYILDQGMDEITLRDGEIKTIPIRRNHAPITHPVLLDGAGHEQLPDAGGVRQPFYLKFRVQRTVSLVDLLVNGLTGPPP